MLFDTGELIDIKRVKTTWNFMAITKTAFCCLGFFMVDIILLLFYSYLTKLTGKVFCFLSSPYRELVQSYYDIPLHCCHSSSATIFKALFFIFLLSECVCVSMCVF